MKEIQLWLITNKPEIAKFAISNGVDRIFVDLELIGKEERQGHLSTVISRHTIDDVKNIRKAIPAGQLMVRSNPIHLFSEREIKEIIDAGANVVMLPMWKSIQEIEVILRYIPRNVKLCLLAETPESITLLPALKSYPEISEIHIGLNDLHLALNKKFMFELLADNFVDGIAEELKKIGKPFGIGGIARLGEGLIPAEFILAEHARLGSQAAILSRTFHRNAQTLKELQSQMDFAQEVERIKVLYKEYQSKTLEGLMVYHQELQTMVKEIVLGK